MSNGSAVFSESPPGAGYQQWDWRMRYFDNPGYFRHFNAGYNAGIHLQPGSAGGVWPTNYRIANGTVGGGFTTGGTTPTGTEPIKMQPPPAGTGPVKFFVSAKIVVWNPDPINVGACAFGLGVADVNGPSEPMYPYLGVGHDLDMNSLTPTYVPPGGRILYTCSRLDICDIVFVPGIPGWPNWQMLPNPDNLLWPAVTPLFNNMGNTQLEVGNVFLIAFNIP